MEKKTLVLGYGNPARGDDGLGPALIEKIDQANLPHVETRVDYQLCVEYAMDIGEFQRVIFVDASRDVSPPFEYYSLDESRLDKSRLEEGRAPAVLDTHGVSPTALMLLARTLFGANTPAYVLAIRGYEFEPFVETLSAAAKANLDLAHPFLAARVSTWQCITGA